MSIKKYMSLVFVLLLGLMVIPAQAQEADPLQTNNFIFINYIGQELFLDLDDVTYRIPGTDTHPQGGELTLNLAAGEHKYAANVPGVPLGSAGEFTMPSGGYIAKAAYLDKTEPIVENGILKEKPKDFVKLADFNPFAAPESAETDIANTDSWQPAPAKSGMSSLVWINHYGDSELTVDIDGQLYKVPAQENQIPGRLQIDISPGFHRFTASVPNGSVNGEISPVAGEVKAMNIFAEVHPREQEVGEEYEFLPDITLTLSEEEITPQTITSQQSETDQTTVDSAPDTLPATGGEIVVPPNNMKKIKMAEEGVLIENYTGGTVTFTINGQTYTVSPEVGQTFISLSPGLYHYTASLPGAATTGTVELVAGQEIEISLSINIEGTALMTYQN